jgi:hypothetical protein
MTMKMTTHRGYQQLGRESGTKVLALAVHVRDWTTADGLMSEHAQSEVWENGGSGRNADSGLRESQWDFRWSDEKTGDLRSSGGKVIWNDDLVHRETFGASLHPQNSPGANDQNWRTSRETPQRGMDFPFRNFLIVEMNSEHLKRRRVPPEEKMEARWAACSWRGLDTAETLDSDTYIAGYTMKLEE